MVKTKNHTARVLGAHIVLVAFLAFVIYPLAYLVSVSFRTGHTLVDDIIPSNPSLEHWFLAFEQPYVGMNPQKKDIDGVDQTTFNNSLGTVTFDANGNWTLNAAPQFDPEFYPLRSYLYIGFLNSVGDTVSRTEPVRIVLDEAAKADEYGKDVIFVAPDGQVSGRLAIPDRPEGATRTTVQYGKAYVSKPVFPVLSWLMNTIKVAGLSGLLILLLSTTSAYAFGRLPFRGKSGLLKTLLVVQMFPNTLFLVALYLLFDKLGGFVDFLALNTHSALIIGYMGGLALNIFMVIGYFDTIDPAMEESAAIDGATPWQTFYKILLPLSVPILAVVFILSFITFVNEFPLASVIISDLDKMTLAVGAQQYIQDQNQLWGDFAAAAVLSGVPITIVFLIAQKFLVGGLTAGGVKG